MSETCTTTAIVLIGFLSTGSTVPALGLAAAIALRILTLVQVKDNDGGLGLVLLANDVCGVVISLVVECRRVMNNGQGIPDHVQWHIQALSETLFLIENFTKKTMKRNFLRKVLSRSKDIAQIARFREMLRQLQRHIQEVNARLEHERAVLQQSMVGTSRPHPQINRSSTSFSGTMYDPNPYSAHVLPPPQPFYPQPQGSFQNFSGASIFINSSPPQPPAMNHNIFSGKMSKVSISTTNRNDTNSRRTHQA